MRATKITAIVFLVLSCPCVFAQASEAGSLESARRSGDLQAQRAYAWSVFLDLTQTRNGAPLFETWHGEDAIFSDVPEARGISGFSRTGEHSFASTGVPVLAYTLYNDAAFDHIRDNRLNSVARLERLRKASALHDTVPDNRVVPAFPQNAIVLKTIWWPVASSGLTALPVWDPDDNAPRQNGNPYTSWKRVVAVDPDATGLHDGRVTIDFAGAKFSDADRIGLDAFYSVAVTASLAERMMRDAESHKAAIVALGRPLRAGDHLLLVGGNIATHELPDWIWATFWWHDHANSGPFADGRSDRIAGAWRNYLSQAAFDAVTPVASDGGPHICFNPWLEGRFPDNGHGGGIASNCIACHNRASYPAVPFLPVTRGDPDLLLDPAYAGGRLRTSMLWSIVLHSKP